MRQTDRAGFILEILQVIRKRRAKATNPVCEFVENYDSFLLVKFQGFFWKFRFLPPVTLINLFKAFAGGKK